jgi:DNA-binding response OmpR family regulator
MQSLKIAPEVLVLLVSEDTASRGALSKMLEDAGYVVGETGSVFGVQDAARQFRFDLALLDLAERADGEDAERCLRHAIPEIKIFNTRGVIRRVIDTITRLLQSSPQTPISLEQLCESLRD